MSQPDIIIPVILAGGCGERLWPVSKADYPKQFALRDANGRSLFEATLERVSGDERFARPVVVGNHEHRFIMGEQLRTLGIAVDIVTEPQARNTAPAIALAVAHVAKTTPEAIMLILPADHRITDQVAFLEAVSKASAAAKAGHLVTFGIAPTRAETGYGYIKAGEILVGETQLRSVDQFVEKPDVITAVGYVESGRYYWNSGMFMARCDVLLEAYAQHAPDILVACREAYAMAMDDGEFIRIGKSSLANCRSISFDHAVMEYTDRAAVLPVALGWNDLGNWASLAEDGLRDAMGNVVECRAVLSDVKNCYIKSDRPLVAAVGLSNMVVVAADDAVLIGPAERMQEVRGLLNQMRGDGLPDTHLTSLSHRPWGHYEAVDRGEHYKVKKLCIKPGGQISLQRHAHRSEHWVVVQGTATVTRAGDTITLHENQSTYIEAGQLHRLQNRTEEDLIIIEVQTGEILEESDIERIEDVYCRID